LFHIYRDSLITASGAISLQQLLLGLPLNLLLDLLFIALPGPLDEILEAKVQALLDQDSDNTLGRPAQAVGVSGAAGDDVQAEVTYKGVHLIGQGGDLPQDTGWKVVPGRPGLVVFKDGGRHSVLLTTGQGVVPPHDPL